MQKLIDKIQVNIPFGMLCESSLDFFIKHRLNPEISIDATALNRYSLADFRNIAHHLHKAGLTITLHGPFMGLAPGSSDPDLRKATRNCFEQMLKAVPVFKPKTVVCHAAYEQNISGCLREVWIEKSVEIWSWLGARIRDEGGILVLENVYEQHPDDIRVLFERLENETVGFCLDVGHQAAFGKVPFATWLKSLEPYLCQLHLHDNNGKEDEHLALGRGTIDFQPVFEYLKTLKKELPVITIEPHSNEDLWPSFEYLERIWD
jgi:sugar phosphate isomerase/epimerase